MKRLLLPLLPLLCACHGAAPPGAPLPGTTSTPPAAALPVDGDALGPRPDTPAPPPFAPPSPKVYTGPNGMTVWLVERHGLPLVAATLAVSVGASSDPKDKQGLAWATANMLDEGAGKLGALALARQIDVLGAKIRTGVSLDYSHASLVVLKRNLAPAFGLFGDVVVRPRFEPAEWKRVSDLWQNDLLSRAREPEEVAGIAATRALYGDGNAYANPVEGYTASARRVQLAELRAFYKQTWRPDLATLVVVGDVAQAELDPLLGGAFGDWKAPSTPKPAPVVPPAPAVAPAPQGASYPRLFVVDRADAPQSVIVVARSARAVADPDAAILTRVNIALGGAFTSRLNQDLREEHGWSYGAHSRVTLVRGPGSIAASAAVQTEHTGDALKAMFKDIDDFARSGLAEEEVAKTRLTARGQLVDTFEEVETAAMRLARDAAVGLPADYEAKASVRRDTASKEDLLRLAHEFDPKDAVIVVVGPRAKIEKQLTAIGAEHIEVRDAEGKAAK